MTTPAPDPAPGAPGAVTPDTVARRLHARLPGLLVATDFDGTLAPLVTDPQRSRPVDGAVAVLARLAGRGARVAVVTGRDATTVLRLGGAGPAPAAGHDDPAGRTGLAAVDGLTVAGLYGLETWHDGTLSSPGTPAAMHDLRELLPGVLETAGADPALWIEDKRLSLVVHARRAADPGPALAHVRDAVAALGARLGLEVHDGRDVLELRLPGFDKAGALRRLVDARPDDAVLYLGDDLGDVPAFAEVRRLREAGREAWSAAVLSSEVPEARRAADLELASPDAVVTLLHAVLDGTRAS